MESSEAALPTGAVTFLFTDIEGSTQHWERSSAAMRTALELHDRLVENAIAEHHGVVFKTGGDSFNAAFGDPHNALAAAMAGQHALTAADWDTDLPINVRMGMHTGTAQLRQRDYFGPTLNRVARVMAAGHGGQVLVSAATHRLLVDDLPDTLVLRSLGTHHLKGLDRPEEIFQVEAPGLDLEFPPLNTAGSDSDERDVEAAFDAKEWQTVFDVLTALEAERPLTGSEHEMLAFALWWLGRHDDLARRFELAYRAFEEEGDSAAAAIVAVWLAETFYHVLAPDIANAWERRAERLLENDSQSIARGYLLRWKTVRAFDIDGDSETALALTDEVMDIARANRNGSLEALALQDRGRVLVAVGEIEEGMRLMDEAMVAAVAGDVNPVVVGRSFCNMLSACDRTGDLRRAGEWSKQAERWCSENETAPYPGVCRIFKAEIMWQHGDWVGAEAEVMRASNELGILADLAGEAWYQFGEMRLWARDDQGAEDAFREALTRGREPVPGYAVLLARQGDPEAAIEMLERALAEPTMPKLDRSKLLPALAGVCIETGDLDKATTAVGELEEIGALVGSDLFVGEAAHCRGNIALARGESVEAVTWLREAVKRFSGLHLPYKAAMAHADLARAHRMDGADSLAQMELKIAVGEFERLGATVDAAQAAEGIHGS